MPNPLSGLFNPPTPEQRAVRDLSDALWDEFESIRQEDASRFERYRQYEAEYESARREANHWDVSDYGRNVKTSEGYLRHRIRFPYQHAITMKHQYRIAGRLPDIRVDRRDSSQSERHRADTMEKLLYSCWRESSAPTQIASGAWDSSYLGAACFDVRYDLAKQTPIFRNIAPAGVLVVPGLENPVDFERVFRFWCVSKRTFLATYGKLEFADGTSAADVSTDADDSVTLVDVYDKTHKHRLAGGRLIASDEHGYGFSPYVIVPNLGPLRQIWGYSDYEFYRDAVRYFESHVSRQADVVRATANGAYLEQGTGQKPEVIARALQLGDVIPGRKDAKLSPVDVAQHGPEVARLTEVIRQSIDDLSFTPAAAWGTIGAATSGSDRALQLGPQMELTALKQLAWSEGLARLNEMMLKLVEQKQVGRKTFRGVHVNGMRQTPYAIVLDAAATGESPMFTDDQGIPEVGPDGQPIIVPRTPEELIQHDYANCVVFENRIDRDDPQFVLTELNKFQQGAQSLYTTLERLGVAAPEEEIKLIEQEAARLPWLRAGMIALIKQQLDAANQNASSTGNPATDTGDIGGALASMIAPGGGASGAFTQDALASGLNGSSNRGTSQSGGVPGQLYGAA